MTFKFLVKRAWHFLKQNTELTLLSIVITLLIIFYTLSNKGDGVKLVTSLWERARERHKKELEVLEQSHQSEKDKEKEIKDNVHASVANITKDEEMRLEALENEKKNAISVKSQSSVDELTSSVAKKFGFKVIERNEND